VGGSALSMRAAAHDCANIGSQIAVLESMEVQMNKGEALAKPSVSSELNPQPLPPIADDLASSLWPQLLWELHFAKRPFPGTGPINFPPAIEDIMAGLHIHTMTYLMMDQRAGQQIRDIAEDRMANTIKSLSSLHDKAVGVGR
jgi:hypothetical protein